MDADDAIAYFTLTSRHAMFIFASLSALFCHAFVILFFIDITLLPHFRYFLRHY